MKKFAKIVALLFAVMLSVSVFAFAEDAEEKTYIVYPKEELALFSADENAPEYMVIGEEELNMLLEEAPEMIDWYEENIKGKLFWNTYDEVYTDDYYLPKFELDVINVAPAWEKEYYGDEVRVAVIDSGLCSVYEGVEFLNVISGKDYTESKTTNDTFGHGTQVTGMIAAAHNDVLVKGISPDVKIVPLKVTNNGTVYTDQVSQAIRDAVDEYECDVINLSLGFPSSNETLKGAVDYAVGKGVTVVAAVGNYKNGNDDESYVEKDFMEESTIEIVADDSLQYPAAYDNVIGVGAVHRWYGFLEKAERISPISRQNTSVLITAPGERVITTHLPFFVTDKEGNEIQQFCYYSYGTSLSAPLVTGAVALLKQANPDLTPAEIMNILAESATDDAKGDGYDTAYGHGVLNVAAAIELAEGNEMLAPDTVTYTVSVKEDKLNGAVSVEDYTTGYIGSHPLGASFTAKAEPTYKLKDGTEYKFAYWANGNDTHVSGKSTYTFTATSNFSLYAVYDEVTDNEAEATEKKVEFWNGNGVLLDTKTANGEGKIASTDIPETPSMTGFSFTDKWLNEDETEFDVDKVLEKALTRVVAQFKAADIEYSITFDDISDETKTGKYGDTVEYTATDGEFDYWTLDGEIVSYDPTIKIALWGADKKLTAVYDKTDVVKKPTVVLDTGADEANFLIYSVPDSYKIVDAGIVFGTEGSTPRVASFHSKASVKNIPESGFGQFTSLPGGANHTRARGYLIYKDPDNVTRVIYAD